MERLELPPPNELREPELPENRRPPPEPPDPPEPSSPSQTNWMPLQAGLWGRDTAGDGANRIRCTLGSAKVCPFQ